MFDIIIVTYNAEDRLKSCIESVKRYTKDYLITVVDNNSSDGTRRYLKSLKDANVIFSKKNLGFCAGANLALRNTYNKFIVLLDDDAEVTKDWFIKLYEQIKDKPKVGIVSCTVVSPNNKLLCADYRVRPLQLVGRGEIDRGQWAYIKECDALIGTCWLMRRELIKKVGYFDERFFPSQHEDIDYCLRVRLAGYRIIYNGKVKIIHHNLHRDGGRNKENWRRFLKKWRNLLHKFPLKDSCSIDRYLAKGVDYLEKNRYKQALNEFKKAESIDKRFSEPLYMGITLEGMGEYDKAIQQFKKVEPLNSLNRLAQYKLALLYKKKGLVKDAQRNAKSVTNYIHNKFFVSGRKRHKTTF